VCATLSKPVNVITLLADRHIPWLDELMPEGVRLLRYDPLQGFGPDARLADALFVRTVTPVNALSFSDAGFERLRFVATASAGVDHVDRGFLAGRGVEFASAAGCNARAVAEFVAAGVLDWHLERGVGLAGRRLGVVGAGNAGSAVAGLLGRLGMEVVLHDPPRAGREVGFVSATVEQVLDVDVLSFHVPLVDRVDNADGFPVTHGWLGADRLEACRAQLVVNAARGGVVDEGALGVARRRRGVDFLGDVWMGEPGADCQVVLDAWMATPHIAGYSVQAKGNASSWIVRDFCRFFDLDFDESAVVLQDSDGSDSISLLKSGGSLGSETEFLIPGGSGAQAELKATGGLGSETEFLIPGGSGVEVEPKASGRPDSEAGIKSDLSGDELDGENTLQSQSHYLRGILHQSHPMFRFSKLLKAAAGQGPEALKDTFLKLRTNEPLRNEYTHSGFSKELCVRYTELRILGAT